MIGGNEYKGIMIYYIPIFIYALVILEWYKIYLLTNKEEFFINNNYKTRKTTIKTDLLISSKNLSVSFWTHSLISSSKFRNFGEFRNVAQWCVYISIHVPFLMEKIKKHSTSQIN